MPHVYALYDPAATDFVRDPFCDYWVELINTRPFALFVFPEKDQPETVH